MFDVGDVRKLISQNKYVVGVDVVPKGHIRIETSSLYPDGTSIAVFLLNNRPATLSDLGQTTSQLSGLRYTSESVSQQRRVVSVLENYSVQPDGRSLLYELSEDLSDISEKTLLLSFACVHVANI